MKLDNRTQEVLNQVSSADAAKLLRDHKNSNVGIPRRSSNTYLVEGKWLEAEFSLHAESQAFYDRKITGTVVHFIGTENLEAFVVTRICDSGRPLKTPVDGESLYLLNVEVYVVRELARDLGDLILDTFFKPPVNTVKYVDIMGYIMPMSVVDLFPGELVGWCQRDLVFSLDTGYYKAAADLIPVVKQIMADNGWAHADDTPLVSVIGTRDGNFITGRKLIFKHNLKSAVAKISLETAGTTEAVMIVHSTTGHRYGSVVGVSLDYGYMENQSADFNRASFNYLAIGLEKFFDSEWELELKRIANEPAPSPYNLEDVIAPDYLSKGVGLWQRFVRWFNSQ